MEALIILSIAGIAWAWISTKNHNDNHNGKTSYYRHLDGRVFRYVGLVQNQYETAYIIESWSGHKQVVGADFFNKCFPITEAEFMACQGFESQKQKTMQSASQAQPMQKPPVQRPYQGGYHQVPYQGFPQGNQGNYQGGYAPYQGFPQGNQGNYNPY